jgi:hypothetical protein
MGGRLINGVLYDYSVAQQERMAMDGGAPPRPTPVNLSVDAAEALEDIRDRQQLAKLIPNLHRLDSKR